MMMPASAWIGSTKNATVLGVMAARSAPKSPKSTNVKPGVNGPKSSRYCASEENPTIVVVRP